MLNVPVPPDDGSIERALAEVDARLAAWSAAMTEAQAALAHTAEPSAEPAVETAEAESQAAKGQAAETQASETQEPESSTSGSRTAPDNCLENAASPIIDKSEPSTTDEPVSSQADDAAPPASRPAQQAAEENDEAMLASLDEETAQGIRVLQRLSPYKRSVHELLEEYRLTKSVAASSPTRKSSWWTRG